MITKDEEKLNPSGEPRRPHAEEGPNICMWIWQMINDDKNVSHNNPYVQKMEFWKYITWWRTVKEQFELIVSSRLYLLLKISVYIMI